MIDWNGCFCLQHNLYGLCSAKSKYNKYWQTFLYNKLGRVPRGPWMSDHAEAVPVEPQPTRTLSSQPEVVNEIPLVNLEEIQAEAKKGEKEVQEFLEDILEDANSTKEMEESQDIMTELLNEIIEEQKKRGLQSSSEDEGDQE